jgi:hypothetical protein
LSLALKCHNEKNRCAIGIAEAITLSTSFILLIALHFCYVFMLICQSLYQCYLPLLRHSASHKFSLSLSPRLLALFSSFSVTHKNPWQPFPFIIDPNKVIWQTTLFHLKGWTQYTVLPPLPMDFGINWYTLYCRGSSFLWASLLFNNDMILDLIKHFNSLLLVIFVKIFVE